MRLEGTPLHKVNVALANCNPRGRMVQGIREGVDRLRRLSESLSKREPRNVSLHLKVSRPFARVCGRDPVVLQLTIGMLESVKVCW